MSYYKPSFSQTLAMARGGRGYSSPRGNSYRGSSRGSSSWGGGGRGGYSGSSGGRFSSSFSSSMDSRNSFDGRKYGTSDRFSRPHGDDYKYRSDSGYSGRDGGRRSPERKRMRLEQLNKDITPTEVTTPSNDQVENTPAQGEKTCRIGTWNVRSLAGKKLDHLLAEMTRLKIDVLGLSQAGWPDRGDFWKNDYRIIHSSSKTRKTGVGFVLNEKTGKQVTEYLQCSDRIIMIKVEGIPGNTVIVQVFMPDTAKEVNEVYEELELVLKMVKGEENLIILGDWNAVIGRGLYKEVVGRFGLGKRDKRGDRLVKFCEQHQLTVVNTLYQLQKRRMFTWTDPIDGQLFQIDYLLVRQAFRKQLRQCKTYPGSDIGSDHNMVAMEYWLEPKEIDETKERNGSDEPPVTSKPSWMTTEILDLIKERNNYKSRKDAEGRLQFKHLKNEVVRKVRFAKEMWGERIDGAASEKTDKPLSEGEAEQHTSVDKTEQVASDKTDDSNPAS